MLASRVALYGPMSLNVRDRKGWSLFHHAAMNAKFDVLKLLVEVHSELNCINHVSMDGWE